MEHQTIGIGNMFDRLVVNTVHLSYLYIDTAIFTTVGTDDIGWNIIREGGASLYHRTLSHTGLGIFDD